MSIFRALAQTTYQGKPAFHYQLGVHLKDIKETGNTFLHGLNITYIHPVKYFNLLLLLKLLVYCLPLATKIVLLP